MFSNVLNMTYDYEDRKVGRYDKDGVFVSTAKVYDSKQPYETAISHPAYNNGKIIIVQMHDSKAEAKKAHKKWIGKMTSDKLPINICDVSTSETAQLVDVCGKQWRKNLQD